jgi:hypothetical protein
MAAPFAKLLLQIVVPVVAVLARALPAAYGQALQNARKSGLNAAEAAAPVFGTRISRSEALQVLNLAEAEANPEAIQKVCPACVFALFYSTNCLKSSQLVCFMYIYFSYSNLTSILRQMMSARVGVFISSQKSSGRTSC